MSPSIPGVVLSLLVVACASEPPAPEWATPPRPAPSLVEGGAPLEAPASERPAAAPEGPSAEAAEDAPAQAAPTAPTSAGGAPSNSGAPEAGPTLVAWVAGTPVSAAELLSEWYWIAGRDVWLVFDKLVATRLATVEAQRLGIRLAPEAVELRVAEENRRLAREVAAFGDDIDVEEFLRRRYGFEPELYFRHLRSATIRQMLAERAVRAWTLGNEWARLRLLIVESSAEVEEVRAALAAGADFAQLARERSLDDSRESGGLVPFLVRQEHSPLARIAFATPIGELGGPLEVSGRRALLQVESRHAPLPGMWPDLRAEVERSLAEHPLSDSEFLHWKLTMEKRYPIDPAPLEELLGGV